MVKKETVLLKDEAETSRFAEGFSRELGPGDVVELIGDLGSGKTFFTRSLAGAPGAADISSPSFVIKNEYAGREFPILHFDFYRLEDPAIVSQELKDDIASRNSLIIIEWAAAVDNLLPEDRYKINFKVSGDTSRELTIYR